MFRSAASGPAVHAFGLTFANPVGLAAGYDKDGLGWRGLALLGFGHLEVGTVTLSYTFFELKGAAAAPVGRGNAG